MIALIVIKDRCQFGYFILLVQAPMNPVYRVYFISHVIKFIGNYVSYFVTYLICCYLIVPLDMKRCVCHFVKWLIHPFTSKGTII